MSRSWPKFGDNPDKYRNLKNGDEDCAAEIEESAHHIDQQRKGAIIPLCVDRKTCSAFVKGPCGGTSSERQDHFGCYRESDTAPVA